MRERSERVSLEQLFSDTEQPERPRPERPWLRDPLVAFGTAVAVWSVLRVMGFLTSFPVLVAAVLALLLVRRVLRKVPIGEPPAAIYSAVWGVLDDDASRFAPIDGLLRAVQRWEARFAWTERDHVRYASAVRPRLYELVAERLRQRHGVSLLRDPDQARALIGDRLWTFLHGTVERTPTARDLAEITAEIEKI